MKKILYLLVLALLVSGFAPITQGLVELPEEGRLLVLTLVTAGLTWLFLLAFEKLGWDLRGYAQSLAAVLSPILITVIEKFLLQIPTQYDTVVLWIIHLLVLLFGSIGTVLVAKALRKPSEFRLR